MSGCTVCGSHLFRDERDVCAKCVFVASARVDWLTSLMLAPQPMGLSAMLRRGQALENDAKRLERIDAGTAMRADDNPDWPIQACIAGAEMEEDFVHGRTTLVQPRGIIASETA